MYHSDVAFFNTNKQLFVNKIDVWTFIYIGMIAVMSVASIPFNIAIFVVYFVMALPFTYNLEYFLSIVMLHSTISYYFVGASNNVLSMQTILVILILFKNLGKREKKVFFISKNIMAILGIGIMATISYTKSIFHYTNGWVGLLYMLTVALIIGNFTSFNLQKFTRSLLITAYAMVVSYLITVTITGDFVNGRLTISDAVNTNSFGKSCAQLATIFTISLLINKKNRIINLLFSIIISIFSFLTGSRGSLLAFIVALLIVSLVEAQRLHLLTKTMFKLAIVGVGALSMVSIISSMYDIDLSRFNMKSIGESKRTLIYDAIIPYIINNNLIYTGYGPGHDCSRQVIRSLITWDFTHTHNTFLEAFAEIGIFGFILTIICTLTSLISIFKISEKKNDAYILFGLLICLIVNSFAESFFCGFLFWCLLALCRHEYDYYENEDFEYEC